MIRLLPPVLNMFRRKKLDINYWSIQEKSILDVCNFKNSVLSVVLEIHPDSGSLGYADLTVVIKNEGENDLRGIFVMATVTEGFAITNSGQVFGTSWRMEKIPTLNTSQKIKYKVVLRSSSRDISGSLAFTLSPTADADDVEAHALRIPLDILS